MIRLSVLLGALLLAYWGQQMLGGSAAGAPNDALLIYLVAAGLFVASARRPRSLRTTASLRPRSAWTRQGRLLALGALAAGAASLWLLWFDLTSLAGLLLWPAAALLFLAGAFVEARPPQPSQDVKSRQTAPLSHPSIPWDAILLGLILAGALAVRLYALDVHPNGCQSDECNNGIDALRWLAGAPYAPYAETNDGQATFFSYLIALSFQLFGTGVPQMRIVSAVTGVLTVAAFYFLARDLYGRYPALFATALLAADRWHLTFSRIVYELIMQPLFMILLFFFLLRALASGRRRYWALAGCMLAGGMNTYTAFRVVPFLLAGFLLFWLGRAAWFLWLERRSPRARRHGITVQTIRQDVEGVAVLVVSALLTLLPLGVYIIQKWDIFTHRIVKIGVMGEVAAAGSWEPVWRNTLKTLFMFNWQGDGGSLNNLPGAPMFSPLVAALFVLGLAYGLFYALQARALPVLYVAWFAAIFSLSVFSAAHEAPSARRTIGMIPLAYLMVALVADQVWLGWQQAMHGLGRRLLAVGAAAIALLVAFSSLQTYFSVQALHPQVWSAYSPIESSIGRYLGSLPAGAEVLIAPRYEHHAAIRLYAGSRSFRAWDPVADVPWRGQINSAAGLDDGQGIVYILEANDKALLNLLQTIYPLGSAQEHRDRYGLPLFLSFEVGLAQVQAVQGLTGVYVASPLAPPARQFLSPLPSPPPAVTITTPVLAIDLAQAPLPPPYAANWQGTLLAQDYGQYVFTLRSPGQHAALQVGQEPVLEVRGPGQETMTVTLPAGFHPIRLDYASGEGAGELQVAWSGPKFAEQALGPGVLFPFDLGRHGLIGYYYPNAEWQEPAVRASIDVYISANTVLPPPYSIRWLGKIAIPVTGNYVFGTTSDDGSLVLIDGKLVVDNSGVHGSQNAEGRIDLEQGLHDLELLYSESGGSQEMQFWWQPPNRERAVVGAEYLLPLTGDELPAGYAPPPPEVNASAAALAGPPGSTVQLPGRATIVARGLKEPRGVAVDPEGWVFVAESGGDKVLVLGPDGEQLGAIPAGSDGFTHPADLVADARGVTVLDETGRLAVFSPQGTLLAELGASASLGRSRGLGSDAQGQVWVASTSSGRVLALGADGSIEQEIVVEAGGSGQPSDVQGAVAGRVFVADPVLELLLRYSAAGQLERSWQIATANTLDSPHLAAAADGKLYLTEPEQGRVLQLSADGEMLGAWDLPALLGRPVKPVGIAAGPDGRIWVTDVAGGNVIVIDGGTGR